MPRPSKEVTTRPTYVSDTQTWVPPITPIFSKDTLMDTIRAQMVPSLGIKNTFALKQGQASLSPCLPPFSTTGSNVGGTCKVKTEGGGQVTLSLVSSAVVPSELSALRLLM